MNTWKVSDDLAPSLLRALKCKIQNRINTANDGLFAEKLIYHDDVLIGTSVQEGDISFIVKRGERTIEIPKQYANRRVNMCYRQLMPTITISMIKQLLGVK